MENSLALDLPTEEDTQLMGKKLADLLGSLSEEDLKDGFNFRLNGDLGAGKTTLVRSVLRGLGYQGRVKSPTFTLLEIYPLEKFQINHFDFYRFEDPEEFEDAGFRDSFGTGKICFTEWTQKASPFVPSADVEVVLIPEGDGRRIEFNGVSAKGAKLVSGLR